MTRISTGGHTGALTLFAGNPSANLDQCANDPAPSPETDGCDSSATQWVNGNLGASKSVYVEGNSIPYRMLFDNLDNGAGNSHTVQIEWDTTKSGKHAIDYLTTWNRSVADADPCLGVSGCSGSPNTFPIPKDPQVDNGSGSPIHQAAGNFSMWGGTITGVSAYTYPVGSGFSGDTSADIVITFTATSANPVLAWGGHIADHHDWGSGNAAVAISGSPYHTRLIGLDGSGGNQDRSLSADAVIFPGTITIVKHASPTDATAAFGFTASSPLSPASFNLDGSNSGTTNVQLFSNIRTFQAYTFNEATVPSGWSFNDASCTVSNANTGTSSVSGAQVTVNLTEGEDWTCTYNNTRATKLTLVKSVTNNNGGTALPSAWTLAANAGGDANNFSGTTGVNHAVTPGVAYSLSESGGPNGYTLTGWSCNGGTQSGASITLATGDNVTCTATNDDVAPQLHLRKVVTNNDGGSAAPTDWTLTATGPMTLSGSTPVDSGSDFSAGTYALSELGGPSGYTLTGWSCTGGGSQNGASITLGLGDNVTCTATNDDNAPQLKLVKVVQNNDGGTAGPADFTLSAAASGGSGSGRDFTSKTASPAFHNVFAGTAYTLSESGPAGYSQSGGWSCDGGTQSGSSITLAPGTTVTCTATNTDDTPQLKLVKVVDNTNGGSAGPADFTLGATAGGARDFTSATASPVFHDVFAGATYTLSDTGGPAGYTAGQWSCDGGTMNSGKTTVTVALGAHVTCTITNTSQAPQLKLVKNVINDDGGTATADQWTLHAVAASPNDGRNFTSASTTPTFHQVFAGASYSLSESGGPAGYTSDGTWTCDSGTLNADKNAITLAPGASATCTITNNDNGPQLKLVKNVVNANGGTATAADFTLSAAASGGNAARDFTSTSATPIFHDVFANQTYNLSETGPAGYTTTGQWTCDGGTLNAGKNAVTVAVGTQVTCTLTNTDVAPQLKLVKHVVNDDGGTATADQWTLHADAVSPNDGRNFTSASATPSFNTVFANATYDLSESGGPAGYSSDGIWTCDGGTMNQAGNAVTLPLGAQVTCTITNNDNGPQLKLVKNVVNDNGGTATAADWTLSATAASGSATRDFTSKTDTPSFHDVFAGVSYDLAEAGGPDAYSSTGKWTCEGGTMNDAQTAVTVALGEQVTCTITNDDIGPTITVTKQLVPATDSGTFDFSITQGESKTTLDNGGKGYGHLGSTGPVTVDAGSATVSEAGHGSTNAGDYTSTWSCSNEQSGTGTSLDLSNLAIGDSVSCTFVNTRLATLIVKKVVDNSNGGGSKSPADFTLHVSTAGLEIGKAAGSSSGTPYSGLLPGTYRVTEDAVSGYSLTSATCDNGGNPTSGVQLNAGQTVTCTLTNTSAAPPPPPPPPPPAPKIDLSITKTGAPNPTTVNKNITWTMVVVNNGPNNATGVTVADPIPAGTTYVSSTTSQGTCTGGTMLSCSLGSLAVGNSVTVSLVTTANQTGTIPNTATVVGNEAETNTANNTASASVNVVGVFKPPVVYCTAVAVSPKQLFVGRTNTLKMRLTQHGKAAKSVRVRIKGSTISVTTKPSNRHGLVTRKVKPMKAGIVTFTPVASKRCNAPRVGVIGVFTPPVTG